MARPEEALEAEEPQELDEFLGEDDADQSEVDEDEERREALRQALEAEYQDAADFIDTEIAPARELAARYYARLPFGDEEEGRSQVIDGTVPDTIDGMRPSIVRVFCSGSDVLRFTPSSPSQAKQAEQATALVNQVLDSDGNSRFRLIDGVSKDALLKKVGFATWRWEEKIRVTEQSYRGLSIGQAVVLSSDPEVEVLDQQVKADQNPAVQALLDDPNVPDQLKAQYQAEMEVTIDMRVRRRREKGYLRVEAVPPEEVVFSRWAKDEDSCTLFGRRRYVKVSDAVALGIDPELVEQNKGRDGVFGVNNEALIRHFNPNLSGTANGDPSQDDVFLFEGYLWFDADEDLVAELHWVRAIGSALEVVEDEIVSDINWACFTPNPEPHTVIGWSVADATMDLQEIKSSVLRGTLDSLASTIFPSLVVVDNAVEIDDVLNTEMGRVIRAKAPGMVQSLAEPFIGPQALGVLDYLDNVRANRTGQSTASLGLDPETMQSTNKDAIQNTLQKSQERLEFICRSFAELGFKRLYKGILRELIRHQDKPRTLRLRGEWVEVDPRDWDMDLDLEVDPMIGRGDDATRLTMLSGLTQKQEQILLQLGPQNPLVGLDNYANALADMAKAAGFSDPSRYFKPLDAPTAEQFAAQAAQQAGSGSADQLLADIEKQKVELKRQDDLRKDDRERDKNEMDALLKLEEINAKFGTNVTAEQIWAAVERDRNAQSVASQERVGMHRNEIQGQVQREAAAARPAMPPQPGGPDRSM